MLVVKLEKTWKQSGPPAIADKAEEVARQQKAAEEQNQSELNKRMLEVQLSQNESELSDNDSIYIYNHKGIVVTNSEITEDWNKPEEIENVVSLLASCESLEMLAELRECAIPPAVFKAAAKSLGAGKRQQIKEWVLMLNQVA